MLSVGWTRPLEDRNRTISLSSSWHTNINSGICRGGLMILEVMRLLLYHESVETLMRTQLVFFFGFGKTIWEVEEPENINHKQTAPAWGSCLRAR